jgi:hypothetical protein
MSRVETSHSVLCLYHNACRDDVLAGCLGEWANFITTRDSSERLWAFARNVEVLLVFFN